MLNNRSKSLAALACWHSLTESMIYDGTARILAVCATLASLQATFAFQAPTVIPLLKVCHPLVGLLASHPDEQYNLFDSTACRKRLKKLVEPMKASAEMKTCCRRRAAGVTVPSP